MPASRSTSVVDRGGRHLEVVAQAGVARRHERAGVVERRRARARPRTCARVRSRSRRGGPAGGAIGSRAPPRRPVAASRGAGRSAPRPPRTPLAAPRSRPSPACGAHPECTTTTSTPSGSGTGATASVVAVDQQRVAVDAARPTASWSMIPHGHAGRALLGPLARARHARGRAVGARARGPRRPRAPRSTTGPRRSAASCDTSPDEAACRSQLRDDAGDVAGPRRARPTTGRRRPARPPRARARRRTRSTHRSPSALGRRRWCRGRWPSAAPGRRCSRCGRPMRLTRPGARTTTRSSRTSLGPRDRPQRGGRGLGLDRVDVQAAAELARRRRSAARPGPRYGRRELQVHVRLRPRAAVGRALVEPQHVRAPVAPKVGRDGRARRRARVARSSRGVVGCQRRQVGHVSAGASTSRRGRPTRAAPTPASRRARCTSRSPGSSAHSAHRRPSRAQLARAGARGTSVERVDLAVRVRDGRADPAPRFSNTST